MDWDAIGAVGQILGAAAVFVTLGYVAIQVRDAKQQLRRSLSQARGEAIRDLLAQARDAHLHALHERAITAEGGQPSPFVVYAMERWGMSRGDAMLVGNLQVLFWQYRLQVIASIDDLSEIERQEFEQTLRVVFVNPGPVKVFYELHVKPRAHPKVLAYLESVLSRPA